jgi:hypothetical protein
MMLIRNILLLMIVIQQQLSFIRVVFIALLMKAEKLKKTFQIL